MKVSQHFLESNFTENFIRMHTVLQVDPAF